MTTTPTNTTIINLFLTSDKSLLILIHTAQSFLFFLLLYLTSSWKSTQFSFNLKLTLMYAFTQDTLFFYFIFFFFLMNILLKIDHQVFLQPHTQPHATWPSLTNTHNKHQCQSYEENRCILKPFADPLKNKLMYLQFTNSLQEWHSIYRWELPQGNMTN